MALWMFLLWNKYEIYSPGFDFHKYAFTDEPNKKTIYPLHEQHALCPTLCDPMDGSLPGSAIHGIFQARILEWAAISFSRGSSQPRDQTRVSCIADRRSTIWATREAHLKV